MKLRMLFLILCVFPTLLSAQESVYCLHGFMRTSSSMEPMATAFRRAGYEATSWGYPSRDGLIEEHAAALVKELQNRAAQNPGEPIHFVTHSLGGIVVRAALNDPNCPAEAKKGRAVLLVPPNRGTRFGHFLNHIKPMRKIVGNKSGMELFNQPNFDHLGQFPEGVDVLVISGTFGWNPFVGGINDGKVAVNESRLPTPHKQMTFFYGHSWIMFADRVIYAALDFISNNEKATPHNRTNLHH